MRYKKNVGDSGEQFAASMLEQAGFSIIERNYRTKYGEIDLIAYKEGVLHFVEVKTRTGTDFGLPSDAVTDNKLKHIRRAAECYLTSRRSYWRDISIDVYEVLTNLITDCG